MGVRIHYMGAKHVLAPQVAEIIRTLPSGPCLDLFAGMCSVAGALAPSGRPAWCNDVQAYAALVAEVLIAEPGSRLAPEQASAALEHWFRANSQDLVSRFGLELATEETALSSDQYQSYKDICDGWRHIGNDDDLAGEAARLRAEPHSTPYRLFTLTFACGYFSVRQAIEIDSLRFAIDSAAAARQISNAQAKWALVALMQAMSMVTTAPGHFAEFLHPRDAPTFQRIKGYRRRSVWSQFLLELTRVAAYGTSAWQSRNRVFCEEAVSLSGALCQLSERPGVVYADPPYSDAQYSRYYHVLETLVLYDYPVATGKGRYRDGRLQTDFSKLRTVEAALRQLCRNVARMGSALVLSYPSNGLYFQVAGDLEALIAASYLEVSTVRIASTHSTMGGAPGEAKRTVEEMLIVGRVPR